MKSILFILLIVTFNILSSQTISVNNPIRSEILKSLDLSSKEKELLEIRRQMCSESEQLKEEVNSAKIELLKLIEIEKMCRDFKDLNTKVLNKIERYTAYEISLRFDIAECRDMQNDILFSIYKNHYVSNENHTMPEYGIAHSEKLKNEAETIYNKALTIRKNAYNLTNEEKCYEELMKSVNDKSLAIDMQEVLFALWLDIPNKQKGIEENNDLAIKNEIHDIAITANTVNETMASLPEDGSETKFNEYFSSVPEKSENVIYKIQIGAFLNPVDIKEFNGLSPLSTDKSDDKSLTKYMVGEYKSVMAAKEAHDIIVNTTPFEDAFIVSYCQNKRVEIVKLPEEKILHSGAGNLVINP